MLSIVIGGVVIIPIYISRAGKDAFRDPKMYLFRTEAILCALCFGLLATRKRIDWRQLSIREPAIAIPCLAVLWTAIATVLSTNRSLSVASLGWVVTAAVVFLATYEVARRSGFGIVWPVLIPAAVNSVAYVL